MASRSDCILWTGPRRKDGYGRIWSGKGRIYAHRAAYCNANNLSLDDIKDSVVRHKCDNPQCVNPAHLEIGTQSDNIGDAVARKRNAKMSRHGRAKLTESQISAIRSEYTGFRGQQILLAEKYGVTQPLISYIVNRKNWKEVK